MDDLALVCMANVSFSVSFFSNPIYAASKLPSPEGAYDAYQQLRKHALNPSRNGAMMDNPSPFSELSPLFKVVLNDGQTVHLICLGDDCDEAPLLAETPAPREPGRTRYKYTDYLEAYLRAAFPQVRFVVGLRPLLGLKLDNQSDALPHLRSAILDHAAEIEKEYGQGGANATIMVNATGGFNVGVDALLLAASAFGWTATGSGGSWKPLRSDLNVASLSHQWGVARALVSEFEATSAASQSGAGKSRDPRGDVDAIMSWADKAGCLSFIVPVRDDTDVDNEVWSVRMNQFGASVLRRRAGEGRPYYSATQRLLAESRADGAEQYSKRLDELLRRWARSDLFGSNQVSELVSHMESHCEAVDRNVAAVAGPLLSAQRLTAEEVFHLGVAAWLHDWGHSGAPFSNDPTLRAVTDPMHFRQLHGLLSAERIRRLDHVSGLIESEKVVPSLIAAHHQGWTSYDERRPSKGVPTILGTVGKSLYDELDAAPQTKLRVRMPLLIAIFRVCDAADVGIHRAWYHEVVGARILDEFDLYGARLAGKESVLQEYRMILRRSMETALQATLPQRAAAGNAATTLAAPNVANFDSNVRAKADELFEWAKHCLEQVGYFETHRKVLGVHLHMRAVADAKGWDLIPLVTPLDPLEWKAACTAVATDVLREIGQHLDEDGVSVADPAAEHKAKIGTLLSDITGVRILPARPA